MFRTLTTLLMACATLFVHPFAQAKTAPAQKAVLVTGASSGLGRVMALYWTRGRLGGSEQSSPAETSVVAELREMAAAQRQFRGGENLKKTA